MQVATAAQVRAMERRAIEEFGMPARVLMERAGVAVLDAVRAMLPEGGRIAVLCGKGNNGGDGLVFARLAHEEGYAVECVCACSEPQMSRDAQEVLRAARAFGVDTVFESDARFARRLQDLGSCELIVDALLGVGARGEVSGSVRRAIEATNRCATPVLSVDVPSGIECDTGAELGASVWALRTVSFGVGKRFMFLREGLERSGAISIAPIGFPDVLLRAPMGAFLIEPAWVAERLPERPLDSNKGRNGSVLIVAGSRDLRGAAVMAADSALRMGAGLVTVAGIACVCDAVAHSLPEALLLELPEVDGAIAPEAAERLLAKQDKYDVGAFGPGLTHGAGVQRFLSDLWAGWQKPAVVDADALNCVSEGIALPRAECVLTPHPGEMGRLLGSDAKSVQADRFGALGECIQRYGQTTLLKGAATLVSAPDSPVSINTTGEPGLATGGTGDVLTGAICSLLGQKVPPLDAACCGAYCHGLAGELCGEKTASIGYRASEVAEALPLARARIVQPCNSNSSSASVSPLS